MKPSPRQLAAGILLAASACAPAADYTESEWPKAMTLDPAPAGLSVGFAPGSSDMLPGDMARLQTMAASGGIAPSDRVVVAVAGPPALAPDRFHGAAAALLPYGIVASPAWLASAPPDRAVIQADRYLVRLPRCPDWSKPAPGAGDFANTFPSNFGCAGTVNLGMMVAMPADLVGQRRAGFTAGQPAATAVNRYLNDQVFLPEQAKVGPIAAPAGQAPGAARGAPGGGSQP
jgi:hypothetical protein